MAVNPHLIKLYSQDKKEEFTQLLFFISKASFFVLLILCVPIYMFADTVLTLWLVNVPPYALVFVKLILVFLLVRSFHSPIDTIFKAAGRIKYYQIVDSGILFLNLPISYFLLKNGFDVKYVFIVMIWIETFNLVCILYLAQRMNEIKIIRYLLMVIAPCLIVTSISVPISYIITQSMSSANILVQLLYLIFMVLVIALSIIVFGLNKREKLIVLSFIKQNAKRFIK